MDNKRYQMEPIELIQFLYGGKTQGVSESRIAKLETRLCISVPKYLRKYYEVCGEEKINRSMDKLFFPEELGFSHTFLEDVLAFYHAPQKEYDELYTELAHVGNYFIFWSENQGNWYAGILEKDLQKENPPVYLTTNDDLYEWEKVFESISAFILAEIYYNIAESDFEFQKYRPMK